MADKDEGKDEKKQVETRKPDPNGALPGVGDTHVQKMPKTR